MRHRNLRSKLRGSADQRRAMYNNMLASLVQHGRIQTTTVRAKILRRLIEREVTRAKTLGDLLLKDRAKLEPQDKARVVHTMRMVRRKIKDYQAVLHLFDDVAPRYLGRPGGYTRISKIGYRKGDGAPVAILEFIEAELPEKEGTSRDSGKKKKRFSWLGLKKGEKNEDK